METLQESFRKITEKLIQKEITIATMESCTAGMISSLLTDTEGASAVFPGGFVTYSNDAKIRAGVPEEVIKEAGVYSALCAVEMAKAAKKALRTKIGIGVTGSFGNVDPNNEDSVPGTVYFGIVTEEKSIYRCLGGISGSNRKLCKEEVAFAVGVELKKLLE